MHSLDDFYTDHPSVGWYKTTEHKRHSQYFSKRIDFWTWRLSILRMPLHTNMLCKRLRVYERLDEKWLESHFLFLSKNHKLYFEDSCYKLLSFNNSANSSWAWQVCDFLKFELCVVYGSNFFWIKFQSTSETVHEIFNFSLKLLSVLSKQLT